MKSKKLLTITSLNYLAVFTVLMLISFGFSFLIIRSEVYKSSDEILYNRKVHIIEEFKKTKGNVPDGTSGYSDFVIKPSTRVSETSDSYADTIIYEFVDNEWDEFRKLNSTVQYDGKFYDLEIIVARLETHEIISSVMTSFLIMFVLMVIAFYLTSRFLSRKLWSPFYSTLHRLNSFEIEQSHALGLDAGKIREFEELNQAISDLTNRTQAAFLNQKQFTENASHEMQTPLAITQSKLELLIEDPNLTEKQAEIIQTLINSTQRLARLNKTLILLSKIENHQFIEKESVILKPIIDDTLAIFEEHQENHKISVSVRIDDGSAVNTNKTILDLLITNLVKNAFLHNATGGRIEIEASQNHFIISNTSPSAAIPEKNLFQRFYKNSSNRESWGLGLAMVKKIADINNWSISYSKTGEMHQFKISFRNS